MIVEKSNKLKRILKDVLKEINSNKKFNSFEVNNDKPFTFEKRDYEVKEGKPYYTDSNKLRKNDSATAVISKNTVAIYSSENIKYTDPINWEKLKPKYKYSDNGKKENIFQRCHIIGYHLSAKFSSPHNIFIGTETMNHGAMKNIENDICKMINDNERTFLYKVTPIYMLKNDIIPIGVLFEYETIDEQEKMAHCKFCFNVQKCLKIKYNDENKEITEKEVKEETNVSKKENSYKNYYVDIRKKVFHVIYSEKEQCEDLKYVRKKYIQEVTGKEEEILNKNKEFKICQKCKKRLKKINKKEKRSN